MSFIFAMIVFGLTPAGRILALAGKVAGRVTKTLNAYELGELRREQQLDLNSARAKWRAKTKQAAFPLLHYENKTVFHETQGWAYGHMLLTVDEMVMLQEYLQVEAHNLTCAPAETIRCGIDGPRLAFVGKERMLVQRLRDEAERNRAKFQAAMAS